MNDLIERYLACWNERDEAARRALVAQTWTEDARYTDPLADVEGAAAIEQTIAAVQAQFPEFVFSPIGSVDAHHQQARFSWGLGPAAQEPVIVGFDVAVTAPDGRISSVLGFLDRVPS
jgi:hypothetical protein